LKTRAVIYLKKKNQPGEEIIELVREIGAEVFEAMYIRAREEISEFIKECKSKK